MNLLKNNNHLLKFNGTGRADSLLIQKTQFSVGQKKTGRVTLTNIPTGLFDSPESVLVVTIPLNPIGAFVPTTKTINLTARTGTTVVVTVTYSYNGDQDVSGITTSLTATPATIQYEKLIGFDKRWGVSFGPYKWYPNPTLPDGTAEERFLQLNNDLAGDETMVVYIRHANSGYMGVCCGGYLDRNAWEDPSFFQYTDSGAKRSSGPVNITAFRVFVVSSNDQWGYDETNRSALINQFPPDNPSAWSHSTIEYSYAYTVDCQTGIVTKIL